MNPFPTGNGETRGLEDLQDSETPYYDRAAAAETFDGAVWSPNFKPTTSSADGSTPEGKFPPA